MPGPGDTAGPLPAQDGFLGAGEPGQEVRGVQEGRPQVCGSRSGETLWLFGDGLMEKRDESPTHSAQRREPETESKHYPAIL